MKDLIHLTKSEMLYLIEMSVNDTQSSRVLSASLNVSTQTIYNIKEQLIKRKLITKNSSLTERGKSLVEIQKKVNKGEL